MDLTRKGYPSIDGVEAVGDDDSASQLQGAPCLVADSRTDAWQGL